MFQHKKTFLYLLISLVFGSLEVLLIKSSAPQAEFLLATVTIPAIVLFFVLFFLCVFFLITFLSKKPLQGLLVATFLNLYLLLRYFGFTTLLYLILLLLIFISVELFFRQKSKDKERKLTSKVG